MINRTILVGRLTADPTLRYTPSGTAVCSFTLAVGRAFKKDETDFIQVIAWKKQAENVANFVHKGSLVGIDGRIQTRNYEKDGKKVYVTEVVADSVQFLDSKKESKPQQTTSNNGFGNSFENDNDPFANDGKPIDIDDRDLPF